MDELDLMAAESRATYAKTVRQPMCLSKKEKAIVERLTPNSASFNAVCNLLFIDLDGIDCSKTYYIGG